MKLVAATSYLRGQNVSKRIFWLVSRKTDVGKVGRCAEKKGLVLEAKPGEGGPASYHEPGTQAACNSTASPQGRMSTSDVGIQAVECFGPRGYEMSLPCCRPFKPQVEALAPAPRRGKSWASQLQGQPGKASALSYPM